MTKNQLLRREPLFLFFVFYIAVYCLFPSYDPGINSASRLATLASMAENRSFTINDYAPSEGTRFHWTGDWSRTPDGNYYSNKAPGPMLLAFPVYQVIDYFLTRSVSTKDDRNSVRYQNRLLVGHILAIIFQVLPFAFFSFFFVLYLRNRFNLSLVAEITITFALCFGSMASIFMSSFFGHGITAALCLGAFYYFLVESYGPSGFLISLAILCDYSCVLFLPGFLAAFAIQKNLRGLLRYCFFAIPGGLLWTWYHTVCFGRPWHIANKFQNPEFLDVPSSSTSLWGILDLVPNFDVAAKLLFNARRGLFYTSPWVVLVFGATIYFLIKLKSIRGWYRFQHDIIVVLSFLLLLWMNASFGGWHGGASPGPRYLSAVLPLFTYLLAQYWTQYGHWFRKATIVSVLVSVLYFILVSSTQLLAPVEPLWPFYLRIAMEPQNVAARYKFVAMSLSFIFVAVAYLKLGRKPFQQSK